MKQIAQNTYQQGDVIFRRIGDARPVGGANVIQKGHCVVAEGEGHHIHVIDAPVETDAELIREGEKMLLNLQVEQEAQHQQVGGGCGEHQTYSLAPGLWEIGGVREIDHFQQLERRVVD